jgi:hypothetical protein
VVREVGKWLVPFVTGLAMALLTAAPAAGMSEKGAAESLSVSGRAVSPEGRHAGEREKVTVEGVADGAHRLYVYGEAAPKMDCPIERVTEPDEEAHPQWLSPSSGEALPAGHFVRTYEPTYEEPSYLVCAYLYAFPARFPDAWEYGCFFKEGNCFMSMLEPWIILGSERSAREVLREQQERRELAERHATPSEASKGAEANAQPEVEPQTNAPACRVPALRGRTLVQARRRLHAAHCSLGKIMVRHRDGKVSSQRPRAGRTLAPGARVSVVLGR